MSLQKTPPERNLIRQPEQDAVSNYASRLFRQVIKSTFEISKQQQVIIFGLLSATSIYVQYHFGLINPSASWNNALALLWTFLGALGMILLFNIIRAPFILDRQQQQRIAELQKHAAELRAELLASEQKQLELTAAREDKQVTVTAAERRLFGRIAGKEQSRSDEEQSEAIEDTPTKPDPDIVCRKVDVIQVHWTGRKFIEEDETKDDPLYAVAARFVNRPKAKGYVPPITFLNAQLTYYDAGGEYYGRVAHAYWLRCELAYYDLDAGGEAALIVAVSHLGGYMYGVNNSDAGASKYEEMPPLSLEGDVFRVQAYLSGMGADDATVEFEIAVKPGELPTIKIADETKG